MSLTLRRHVLLLILLLGLLVGCGGHRSASPPGPTGPLPPSTRPRVLAAPVRAVHVVLRRLTLERARWLVRLARQEGFNTVIAQVTDGVQLDHAPWTPLPDAWTLAEFVRWITYAKQQGLEVIPELKLLTHQQKFVRDPALLWNRETYDPRNPEVYRRVFAVIDELLTLLHPQAFHIGHDEVFGHREPATSNMLPAHLYLQDVRRLHAWLTQRGVAVWMWGDMLISPDEFPGMDTTYLHGGAPGYGRALRRQLPRDMTICDWHYTDTQTTFPSLARFAAEGFSVLGTVWKKPATVQQLSRYAAQHGARGMIVGTFSHVQRGEWDVVTRIVQQAGLAFRQAFPDP